MHAQKLQSAQLSAVASPKTSVVMGKEVTQVNCPSAVGNRCQCVMACASSSASVMSMQLAGAHLTPPDRVPLSAARMLVRVGYSWPYQRRAPPNASAVVRLLVLPQPHGGASHHGRCLPWRYCTSKVP